MGISPPAGSDQDIQTAVQDELECTPEQLAAKEVARALKWASDVPTTVKATITDHAVTLTGNRILVRAY